MTFDQIIAQDTVKQHLLEELQQGRVPHALMLYGPEGCGALPIAVAYAVGERQRPPVVVDARCAQSATILRWRDVGGREPAAGHLCQRE